MQIIKKNNTSENALIINTSRQLTWNDIKKDIYVFAENVTLNIPLTVDIPAEYLANPPILMFRIFSGKYSVTIADTDVSQIISPNSMAIFKIQDISLGGFTYFIHEISGANQNNGMSPWATIGLNELSILNDYTVPSIPTTDVIFNFDFLIQFAGYIKWQHSIRIYNYNTTASTKIHYSHDGGLAVNDVSLGLGVYEYALPVGVITIVIQAGEGYSLYIYHF